MMRSMFTGVSSLRVHQTRMDVIANNIANVNTVGFKASRATFADAFYERLQGAAGPDPLLGRVGTNAMQIGMGLNLASIDNIMTQGATQRTDNSMDVALTSPGFFIVSGGGGQSLFTRAGNVQLDSHMNMHINGMALMGWRSAVNPVTGMHEINRNVLQPLSLADQQNMGAEPTTLIDMVGNLNTTQMTPLDPMRPQGDMFVDRTKTIFDSLGNRYTIDIRLTYHRSVSAATGSPASYWSFQFLDRQGEPIPPTPVPPATGAGNIPALLEGDPDNVVMLNICLFGSVPTTATASVTRPTDTQAFLFTPANAVTSATLRFNSRGELSGIAGPTTRPATQPAPPAAQEADIPTTGWLDQSSFNMVIAPGTGVAPSATFGNVGNYVSSSHPGTNPSEGIFMPVGTDSFPVGRMQIRMNELFQRGGENTTVRSLTMDGNGPGTLEDLSIGPDGTIMGRFTNGRVRELGQIPTAIFNNPAGLDRIGNGLWAVSANSGPFDGIGVIGTMQGGALEMSNVDIADEFTQMITTQRGFQAASRTITVSDEMLQELVNLRR